MPKRFLLIIKLVILLAVAGYFLWYAFALPRSFFLDGVNLLIHEAGHWVFWFFGEFIRVAGGTIMQLAMPLAFVLYFYFKKSYLSSALVGFWFCQNIINVSVYLADAKKQVLPLLGGGGGIHDWHYLLGKLNLLGQAEAIALSLRVFSIVLMFGILIFGVISIFSLTRIKRKSELMS